MRSATQLGSQCFVDMCICARVSNFAVLEFSSLQTHMFVTLGEPTLVFFRLYNPMSFDVLGLSLYYVYPQSAAAYLHKIQCFCFEIIHVQPLESVELPVLLYVSTLFNRSNTAVSVLLSYVLFIK